jgi:hypothetical protein
MDVNVKKGYHGKEALSRQENSWVNEVVPKHSRATYELIFIGVGVSPIVGTPLSSYIPAPYPNASIIAPN